MSDIETIEKAIGVRFHKKELLVTALTHASYANENQIGYEFCNERLEFLGDAILELVVRYFLFEKFAHFGEDILTEKKKSLTNRQFLAQRARDIGLERFLRLGRGEAASGGKHKDSILANVLEAVFGAIYLDQGFEAAFAFFFALVPPATIADPAFEDPKSQLNSWATKHRRTLSYRIVREEGAPHRKFFYVEVVIDNETISAGEGKSKKTAEQDAARKALEQLLREV